MKPNVRRLRQKFAAVWPLLDERTRRLMAASEALGLAYGGVALVHRACGLSRRAIAQGIREIRSGARLEAGRIRRRGAGRKPMTVHDPHLLVALDGLIEPDTRGDPESPLRWVCKSTRALAAGLPVLSVDTKKKELVGNYANAGQQWRPAKQALRVQGHDFPSPDVPRAYPYGIYDVGRNEGFVNVGTDHDTGAFAVTSIRGWWRAEGRHLYAKAHAMLITADAGGSNGSRLRLWKWELQKFADETRRSLSVCHFPPGTSKWNKVEHRLFSFISSNWRGEPLRDYETIVNLIANTTTAKGLKVSCRLDRRKYATGREVSDAEMETVRLERNRFHGDWNYVIKPRRNRK